MRKLLYWGIPWDCKVFFMSKNRKTVRINHLFI